MKDSHSDPFETLLPSVSLLTLSSDKGHLSPATTKTLDTHSSLTKRVSYRLRDYQLNYSVRLDLKQAISDYPKLDDSYSYEIDISNDSVVIHADTEWGAITACSTLFQLNRKGSLPICSVSDSPVYPWRGLMIDTSRHFIPIERLRETIDLMAVYRLNVLHLNLSNDQACRFDAKSSPKLAAEDHFSTEELVELVEYAADRAIRVVPELDVPGHVTSWIDAYPEWGASQLDGPSTGFGVHKACLDPTRDKVREAVYGIFSDLSEVFPDEFIHIGGDEVVSDWWDSNPDIQSWMSSNGLSSAHELQTWFISDLVAYVNTLGKQTVAWDEVLDEKLSKEVVIQAWRGAHSQFHSVRAGHRTLVSAPYYLDLSYSASFHYSFEPSQTLEETQFAYDEALNDHRLTHVKQGISKQKEHGHFPSLRLVDSPGTIEGGEACMWTELVDSDTLHRRVWSRMPAIAERLWNGENSIPSHLMNARLVASLQQIESWRNIDVGANSTIYGIKELNALFDQIEPIKWYSRGLGASRSKARMSGHAESNIARPYDLSTSLNRPIDFLLPDSHIATDTARRIRDGEDLTDLNSEWQELYERFDDFVQVEPRLEELREVSSRLSELAAIGQGKCSIDMDLVNPVGEYLIPIAWPIIENQLKEIASNWDCEKEIAVIDKGHINDSFVVNRELFLQRLNSSVFNTDAVLSNRRGLDDLIKHKVPKVRLTEDGADALKFENGEVWRAAQFIPSQNFNVLPINLCFNAGAAFGDFLTTLKSTDYVPEVVIPGFHDIGHYLETFDSAVAPTNEEEQTLIVRINDLRQSVIDFPQDEFQVIHGDCKVNNLLFDLDGTDVVAIVDLDTLMLGHPAWDFGDLIRSVLTGRESDEEDLQRLESVVEGFSQNYTISRSAFTSFAHAPAHMSFMLAVRFLTDHLVGDSYFKVSYRGENLDRAEEQLDLHDQLKEKSQFLQELLHRFSGLD